MITWFQGSHECPCVCMCLLSHSWGWFGTLPRTELCDILIFQCIVNVDNRVLLETCLVSAIQYSVLFHWGRGVFITVTKILYQNFHGRSFVLSLYLGGCGRKIAVYLKSHIQSETPSQTKIKCMYWLTSKPLLHFVVRNEITRLQNPRFFCSNNL